MNIYTLTILRCKLNVLMELCYLHNRYFSHYGHYSPLSLHMQKTNELQITFQNCKKMVNRRPAEKVMKDTL